jgi:uncharacterized protein YdhG (YjbR/CyaY superfamily)
LKVPVQSDQENLLTRMAMNREMDMRKRPASIDDYIGAFPEDIRLRLETIRQTIKKAAPKAEETISYGMPAFKQNGMIVWFAAFKHHIGFYPGATGISHFAKPLSKFKGAKGSVQFPFDEPLPLALVSRIVRFRRAENAKRRRTK